MQYHLHLHHPDGDVRIAIDGPPHLAQAVHDRIRRLYTEPSPTVIPAPQTLRNANDIDVLFGSLFTNTK